MTCPECEYNKARAALWRNEAYKQAGKPLPWDADEVLAKAVAAEREACAKVCEELTLAHPGRADLTADQCAAALRSRT